MMEARVKATGEIVEIAQFLDNDKIPTTYDADELIFLPDYDYWTRLEHRYAGMVMQGVSEKYLKEYQDFCADYGENYEYEAYSPEATMKDFANTMADVCYYFAHALVEKMKEGK